ncbi:MAG: MerR family transcriptional regulator [Hyphomonas sp.]|nr:MerR family transcriptional regulator [Hyphomonas sp.]
MNSALSIGEAARRTGCSVATIRFYEEMGLIPEAGRTAGGRRVFTRPGVERLRLIRRLRSMEFSIEAIKELLAAMSGAGNCLDVRDIAEAQLLIVRARRIEIDALERTLAGLAGKCNQVCSDGPSPDCSIVDELASTRF